MAGPTPIPFFLYPFCIDGTPTTDIETISPTGADSGVVNYQHGFTTNYELPSSNPATLPVPRQQFNQLMFDITSALQQYQLQGTPMWIAPGSGGPANYPLWAYVIYNPGSGNQIWQSQIINNTSVPGADVNWMQVTPFSAGVPPGTVIDFAGPLPPAGYFECLGQALSRTTYVALLNATNQIQSCTTTATSDVLTVVSNLKMYVGMAIEGTDIPAGTTLTVVDFSTPTQVTMSQAAVTAATNPVRFFQWGNGDGATTFNIPNQERRTKIGAGGMPSSTPNGVAGVVTGQGGGEEAHTQTVTELATHDHTYGYTTVGSGFGFGFAQGTNLQNPSGTTSSVGSSTPFNVMQPSNIYTMCIKY